MKRLLMFCVVGVLAFAGCGGSDDEGSSDSGSSATTSSSSSGGGAGTQLTLAADQSGLKFDKTTLTAKAGKVTITMTNPSSLSHNVALKGGVEEKGDVVGQGGKSVVTADL